MRNMFEKGETRWVPSEASRNERANRRGLRATRLYIRMKILLRVESPPSLVCGNCWSVRFGESPDLTRTSNLGRSISTGQASLHAPHNDDAWASGTKSLPKNPAEMTEPMGPE